MKPKNRFNKRAFTALMAGISGLGLPITGLMNHLYGMEPLTARRHAWMSAHNSLAIVFTVTVVWHVILNRQALLRYIRTATTIIPAISREMIYAMAVVSMVLFIAVGHAIHLV
jgi:hypothetical protein